MTPYATQREPNRSFSRGLPRALAPAFGVHPTTIWRDLQYILYGGRTFNCWREGEFLFSVTRAYPGGPVLSVQDEDGSEIRGPTQEEFWRPPVRFVARRRTERPSER